MGSGTESGVASTVSVSVPVGLPQPGAALPTPGVTYQMCILKRVLRGCWPASRHPGASLEGRGAARCSS